MPIATQAPPETGALQQILSRMMPEGESIWDNFSVGIQGDGFGMMLGSQDFKDDEEDMKSFMDTIKSMIGSTQDGSGGATAPNHPARIVTNPGGKYTQGGYARPVAPPKVPGEMPLLNTGAGPRGGLMGGY